MSMASKALFSPDMTTMESQSVSSGRKLIDYTKNRARFVGERRRKRSSMCSDFQTTIDRAVTRASEEDQEATSISTAGSTDLIVFYVPRQYRRRIDEDLKSLADEDEEDCDSHADELEGDVVSQVSESETPSEGAHFGYLPGAIRHVADPLNSPRPTRAASKKIVEEDDESIRSLDSTTDKDQSSVCHSSFSECSTHATSAPSQDSSVRSFSCRSVRSYESLQLGLLSHELLKQRGVVRDNSQSSIFSSSFHNQEEKSVRSACSRSATGRSLDSIASSLLRTPNSHNRGKTQVNRTLSGGYHIRSNHVHTPSSVKKSKYLLAFTSSDSDREASQRSARSTGGSKSGRREERTISLKDFFRKEEVRRINPDISKQTMKGFTQKLSPQKKTFSSEMTPHRKRVNSDASAPETPVTASMTSQTMSTPSTRGGLLRTFSFSDKGNTIIAELNQTLKQGLLSDLEDDDDCTDDASVANSEALASLMDGLRSTSMSSRSLDVSSAHSVSDLSSRLGAASMAHSANEKPLLYRSHSDSDFDSDSFESDIDSMEQIMKALKSRSGEVLQAPTESLLQTTKTTTSVEKKSTFEDETNLFEQSRRSVGNQEATLVDAMLERQVGAGYISGKESFRLQDGPNPLQPRETKKLSINKSTPPPAGFLIQPYASPLRRLPRITLPFAPIDCRLIS